MPRPRSTRQYGQEDGRFLLEDLKVTDFVDFEERPVGVEVSFSLDQKVGQASGGGFVKGDDWAPKVEIGTQGGLIAG